MIRLKLLQDYSLKRARMAFSQAKITHRTTINYN